jgi:large subunit ribosomal protein L29
MKASEIRELTDKQIGELIKSTRLNLTRLKLSHAVTPSTNPMEMKELKKTIARLKTESTSRKLSSIQN